MAMVRTVGSRGGGGAVAMIIAVVVARGASGSGLSLSAMVVAIIAVIIIRRRGRGGGVGDNGSIRGGRVFHAACGSGSSCIRHGGSSCALAVVRGGDDGVKLDAVKAGAGPRDVGCRSLGEASGNALDVGCQYCHFVLLELGGYHGPGTDRRGW